MFSTYHDESTAITSFMPLDPMAIIHHHVTEDAPLNGVSQHGLTNYWAYGDTSPNAPFGLHDVPAPAPLTMQMQTHLFGSHIPLQHCASLSGASPGCVPNLLVPYVPGHHVYQPLALIGETQETSPSPWQCELLSTTSSCESAGLQPTEGCSPSAIEDEAQSFQGLQFDKFPILEIPPISSPLSAHLSVIQSLCTVLVDPITGVKSFVCILCDQPIRTRKSNLRNHLAPHDRGRPRFVCAWQGSCGRNYSQRSDCKGHIERDHLLTRPKRGNTKHRTTQPDGSRATRRAVHV
ncbi:hypothetical protein BD309DRAFT_1012088 [Dichomitus squalens]|nr:hypothetical protein BD309DRAFT_1012088 [Dichomitus squalens]